MGNGNGNGNGRILQFVNGNPSANKVTRMFAEAQEETFRKVAKNKALVERSIIISRGITFFYPNGVRTGQDVKEILAAKALGLMQSLTAEERDAFLRNSKGKIMSIFDREDVFGLFEGECTDPERATDRKVDLLREILSYEKDFHVLFQAYRDLYVQDVMDKERTEYNEQYALPILSGEIPPAVIYAKLLDLSIEPEKKVMEVGISGPYYNDREMMQLLQTMMDVYYPLADAMGLGTTLAIRIRRNATGMLENLLRRKAEAGEHTSEDVEMLTLYELCKGYYGYITGPATRLAESFIISGKLQGIMDALGKRFDLRIELASHTSDKDDVYRIKGPSGMFWKIVRYRKKGIEDYNINKIKDVLACTIVVDGSFEDAKDVANRLTRELRQSLKAVNVNVKSIPRETGYTVPHVTCIVKVGNDEVPFEIQVRPVEVHAESKVGSLSHATKISGFITGPLVEKLKSTFQEMEGAHNTQRISKASLNLGGKSEKAKYSVRVLGKRGELVSPYMNVFALRGECVGGIVALSRGFSKGGIEVVDGSGKRLDLFEECPGTITITLKGGPGINRDTCKMLMAGKVITPEALEIVAKHCKTAPRKGLFGRKG